MFVQTAESQTVHVKIDRQVVKKSFVFGDNTQVTSFLLIRFGKVGTREPGADPTIRDKERFN